MAGQVPASAGERIRRRRIELGLTQSELGAHWCSKGYVSLVERGKLAPSWPALNYFAAQLGREPAWFLADPACDQARIRRLLGLTRVSLCRNRTDRAGRLLRAAAARAMDIDDQHSLATVLELAGHLHMALHQLPDALRSYRLALRMFRALGSNRDAIACACSLINALLVARSLETARAELKAAEEMLRLPGARSPLTAGGVDQAGGMVALASGDFAQARERLKAAVQVFANSATAAHGAALLLLGLIDMGQRRWQSGGEHLALASQLLSGTHEQSLAAAAAQWLTEARARQRRWDDATRAAQQAIRLLAPVGAHSKTSCALIRLAEVHLATGNTAAAREAARAAREHLKHPGKRHTTRTASGDCDWRAICEARLAYVEAAIIRRTGNPALAEQHLRVVAAQLAAWPEALLCRVQALHERAACLSEIGRTQQAEACYAQALAAVEGGWPAHDPALPDLSALYCMPSPLWFRA